MKVDSRFRGLCRRQTVKPEICLNIGSRSPDILMVNEPKNNLDIQNVEILTAAVNNFRETLIVVSHDETFLYEIHIERTIAL